MLSTIYRVLLVANIVIVLLGVNPGTRMVSGADALPISQANFRPDGAVVKVSENQLDVDILPILSLTDGRAAYLLPEEEASQSSLFPCAISTPVHTTLEPLYDTLTNTWQDMHKTVYVANCSSFQVEDVVWHNPTTGKIVSATINFVQMPTQDGKIALTQAKYRTKDDKTWYIEPPHAALNWITHHAELNTTTASLDLGFWDNVPVWIVAQNEETRRDYYFDAQHGQ